MQCGKSNVNVVSEFYHDTSGITSAVIDSVSKIFGKHGYSFYKCVVDLSKTDKVEVILFEIDVKDNKQLQKGKR